MGSVPKFGDWDAKVPASGERYTEMFEKIGNNKKGEVNRVPTQQTQTGSGNSQRKFDAYRAVNKFKTSFKKSFNSIKKKWVSCVHNG